MNAYWAGAASDAAILALFLRVAGGMARQASSRIPGMLWGWLLCAAAAWAVSSIAGALTPLWVALTLGVGGVVLDRLRSHWSIRAGGDIAFLTVIPLMSEVPVQIGLFLAIAAVYVPVVMLGDAVAARVHLWLKAGVAVVPAVIAFQWAAAGAGLMPELWKADKAFPLYLALGLPDAGERVVLEGGVIVWVMHPPGDAVGGALLFHGANADGSHQDASFVQQRALLRHGFMVVSLDHPGYGESASAGRNQPLSAWDPVTGTKLAYHYLDASLPPDLPRIIVGHSMGAGSVLGLLARESGLRPDLAVILAGSARGADVDEDYWYARFHRDRRLGWKLPKQQWREIVQRFYDNEFLALNMDPEYSPLLFVELGVEWPDVRVGREVLKDSIPGYSRIRIEGVTHYLSAFSARSLIALDLRALRNFGMALEYGMQIAENGEDRGRGM